MGSLFYIIAPSSSGKDTILQELLKIDSLSLREVASYTTRPIRSGETEGVEYHFITEEDVRRYEEQGKIIELRAYSTVYGIWKYMTIDDGSFNFADGNYITAGTVESYIKVRDYFGEDIVIPIYIEVETGERLLRAIHREKESPNPKYAELCRRFLADEEDFSREHLLSAGLLSFDGTIRNSFKNDDFQKCLNEIRDFILHKEK